MKKLYLSLSSLAMVYSYAQTVSWQRDIASNTQDLLTTMTSTIDRQILLSGSSIQTQKPSNNSGQPSTNNGYDYHLLKLDQQGQKVWEKYFGGSRHDYLMGSVATQEGGFAIIGTSFSNQSGDKKENNLGGSDVWMLRLDENGNELWQKTLGTKSNDDASAIVQSTDQGFFVAGSFVSAPGSRAFGSKDVFVAKLDQSGQLKQTTILGGTSVDEVSDMIATPDGGAVVLIYSTSQKMNDKASLMNDPGFFTDQHQASTVTNQPSNNHQSSTIHYQPKTEESFGAGDFWIVKLDKTGKVEWQKSYGGSGDDRPKSVAYTDTGYLVAGETTSPSSGNKKDNVKEGTDLWVLNLDKQGNELWQKSYNFGNRDVVMSVSEIRKSEAGSQRSEVKGFLLGGYTQAEEKVKMDDEKFWMLYIDHTGKEEWRRYVEGKEKKNEERLVSARFQRDGSYLLAGTSADQLGGENWKVMKLGGKALEDLAEHRDLRIYPNPVKDYCYVEIEAGVLENGSVGELEIVLTDMSGRQVQTLRTNNPITKINTGKLPKGVYVVTAKTQNKKLTAKIVKE
ncbi:T9SS type A sorting domain-containing protein [Flavobacterium sp. B17]|uniref:T9SS type A sorting domain-containing protein n=1 Tax=Flavobacterium sp. B17 TaxID=95618 RepID=UPI000348B6AD|nr:T9SS type A sorting domain-containing protein [Flavobacterium sp. B17]